MKTLIAAIGALTLLPIAAATEVAVTFSDDFAEELADNYGEREGEELTEDIIDDLERAVIHANDVIMLVRDHSNERPPVATGGSQSGTIFTSAVASQDNARSLYSQLSGDVEFTSVQ